MSDYAFNQGVARSEAAHLNRHLDGPAPGKCCACGRPCDRFADFCDACEDVADAASAGAAS